MEGFSLGRLWGFPIRLHPSAIILGLILVMPVIRAGQPALAAMWLLAIALSVVLHELGHALVIRSQGHESVIVLHGFGGVTLSSGHPSPAQQIAVSLAGPAINFGLIVICYFALQRFPFGRVGQLLDLTLSINIFLAVFNILPILPLDGGQAFRACLQLFIPRRANRAAAWISILVVAPVLAYAAAERSLFMGLIALFLLVSNYRSATES